MLRRFLICFALVAAGCSGTAEEQKKEDPKPVDYTYAPQDEYRSRNLVPTKSAPENVLIKDATIMTATGELIEDGDIWLREGKIVAIGVELDAVEATVVDAKGKFVTPGIIDTHSHLGVYPTPGVRAHADGNEATSPTRADVDAIHSVWPQDPGFYTALQGGITSLQILPGSANLIGGSTVTLQMHPGVSSRAMLFEGAPRGIKMACGENPKRVYGNKGGPSTRMGNMAGFRKAFQGAKEALDGYERHAKNVGKAKAEEGADTPPDPKRSRANETLMAVLEGKTLVHVHCYRADEMVQILELADEYGFRIRSFHHAVEAYKIRDVLAKWDVSVSTWADWWGFKIEAHDAIVENAGLLQEAGVRAIIHSDSATGIQRLNQEAAKAFYQAKASGLKVTENDALRWITANPAWALGVSDVTGTLDEGKRADVVVWSAHPFSVYAKAEKVWVEGVREFDIEKGAPEWSDFKVYQVPEAVR